jgi:hypothetical protein
MEHTMTSIKLKDIQRVSSTTMQRSIGLYLNKSLKEPLLITTHDRDTHALISIEEFIEYQKLKDGYRISLHLNELSDEEFQTIMDAEIPPEHDPEKR